MRAFGLALAAVAAGSVPAGGAGAKTDAPTWVNHILVEWDAIQRKDGWVPQGEIRPGALATGGEAKLDYPLAAGTTYRFVVVCEPGCGAGDVELLDPAGARVGDPKALVEMPKLDAAPAAAGTYRLRVAMTDCASATCAWSARLYARGLVKSDK
ncbi:MAG TPA: hypothetical protein VFQ67_00515 [Allosphingosinicella sp.]|jgi:hypothetical protein|nr:hypothetical protein [Allosphingosinicella sp.]